MDMIIAPRDLPPGMLPKNLETEVSWGALATEENLRSVVLSQVRSCETTIVKTFEFSLDEVVDRHFSEEDGLWPWVIRVKAVVVDRKVSVVARGEGELQNEWRPASLVGESPNKSLERTRDK
ncbi:MAG TPA: hypothetical protein VK624_03715 [Steroidobacteraceae bacterium]|nr:hypothetical protein [Steroidobacteraceae bacterium]